MIQQPGKPESLRPILDDAQTRLEQHLDDVCKDNPRTESTGELIKLEETLSLAAEAAKEAISLRRRIKDRGDVRKDVS
jgi:hypothetical protein